MTKPAKHLDAPHRKGAPEEPLGCSPACDTGARYTPFLMIALCGRERVSRVALPLRVCAAHRETFPERFLTAGRQATIEGALRLRDRGVPDWSRTSFEFVLDEPAPARPAAGAP